MNIYGLYSYIYVLHSCIYAYLYTYMNAKIATRSDFVCFAKEPWLGQTND